MEFPTSVIVRDNMDGDAATDDGDECDRDDDKDFGDEDDVVRGILVFFIIKDELVLLFKMM